MLLVTGTGFWQDHVWVIEMKICRTYKWMLKKRELRFQGRHFSFIQFCAEINMHFFHPLTGRFNRNKKFGGRKSHFFFLRSNFSVKIYRDINPTTSSKLSCNLANSTGHHSLYTIIMTRKNLEASYIAILEPSLVSVYELSALRFESRCSH